MGNEHRETISENRRAFRDYELMDRVEAGLVLRGTEIKSIRTARVNLQDAYAQVKGGEMWLYGLHVAAWPGAGPWNHEPLRPRKLLLHRDEIRKLRRATGQKGLTLVPLRMYIRDHHAKVELALARGRRQYDKRQAIIKRETEREIARSFRRPR
jgi:SsrA-binding protein